jgi:hypothetical protein
MDERGLTQPRKRWEGHDREILEKRRRGDRVTIAEREEEGRLTSLIASIRLALPSV